MILTTTFFAWCPYSWAFRGEPKMGHGLSGEYLKKWLLVCYIQEYITHLIHQSVSELTVIKFAVVIQKCYLFRRICKTFCLKYFENIIIFENALLIKFCFKNMINLHIWFYYVSLSDWNNKIYSRVKNFYSLNCNNIQSKTIFYVEPFYFKRWFFVNTFIYTHSKYSYYKLHVIFSKETYLIFYINYGRFIQRDK